MADTHLGNVVKIKYVTAENSVFTEKPGFVSLAFTENGETKEYPRIKLQRNFPFDTPEEFVSVLDDEDVEIAMIRRVGDLDPGTAETVRRELARKYFTFRIEKILSVKQTFGFSIWRVRCDGGEREFTVQDTYRSFKRIGGDRATVSDVDGNRYEIESLSRLDRASMKKIELYI